jgi:tetraacyldisaccharide 4'-kinase
MKRPEKLWFDERPGLFTRLGRAALLPAAALYGGVSARRLRQLRARQMQVKRPPIPIISVGNFVMGGGGKTPLVAELVARMAKRGFRVGILTRGYGGDGQTHTLHGNAAAFSAKQVGDEALLLARRFDQAIVQVDKDRTRGAWAAFKAGAQCLILDDGLQHAQMPRDLDVVAFKGPRPLGNGRIFPAGPLRENPLRRKVPPQLWVHTREDQAMKRMAGAEVFPVIACRDFLRADGSPAEDPARAILLCGIADPRSPRFTLESQGCAVLAAVGVGDHVPFAQAQVEALAAKAERDHAALVITEKDWARMGPSFSWPTNTRIMRIGLVFSPEDERVFGERLGALIQGGEGATVH